MINGMKGVNNFFEDALNLRAHRQQMLASNIANADTPNYKAVDVDFASVLKGAQSARGVLPMDTSASTHMKGHVGGPLNAAEMYRVPSQASIDGNTVDTNVEMAQFTDNAIHYQAVLSFLNMEVQMRKSAIQGQ